MTSKRVWLELGGMRRVIGRSAPSLLLLAGALALWQVLTVVRHVPTYLLPGPVDIWRAGVDEHDLLLTNAVPTLEIAVFGFALAALVGLAVAVAIRFSPVLEAGVYPIVIVSQTVPVVALAPVLVVLLGFTILPKLIIVALICFFPITVNAVDGFHSVDPDLVKMMRSFGAGRWRIFRAVEWPSALPFIFSGAKVAVTFSVVGALFGEWAGSSEGLGYLMTQKESQFDTGALFAAIALLSLIGIALFAVVSLAERLLLPWYHGDGRRKALNGRRV
jgi:ABC-type nitrate/sulfonate/bicarbonate transport system permease component